MLKKMMTPSDRVKAWSSIVLQLGEWEKTSKWKNSQRIKAWSALQMQLSGWENQNS